MSKEEARLLQELQTHQVELELQNEELRRLQAELEASRARYFDLYDLAPVGYLTVDAKGSVLEANHTAAGLLGLDRMSVQGQPLSRFILPEDQDAYYLHRKRRQETGQPQDCDIRLLRRGSDPFWARLTAASKDQDGAPVTRVVINDISESHRAFEELSLLRKAINGSGEAIFLTDRQGTFTFVNSGFTAMYGFTAEEVVGKATPRVLKSGNLGAAVYADFWAKLLRGEELRLELTNKGKDGSLLEVEARASAVHDEEGAIVAFLGIQRDISRRKKAEAELRQTQKMEVVGRLAGGVAHDFNNLLTAILGNCGFLLGDIPEGDPKHADVVEIRDASLRAAALTRQLLAFSRKQVMQKRPLDLNALLDGAATLLRRLLGENISMKLVCAPGLPQPMGDPGQLEQVVMNLALNARDAMPKGGELTFETGAYEGRPPAGIDRADAPPAGRYVYIKVTDTGTGMSPEVQRRLFEPFFTTKENGKGTGLGLSTAFGIVRQLGGVISISSVPGTGSVFTVYLPLAEPQSGADAAQASGHPPARTKTAAILLVEDEGMVRRLAVRILTASGHAVLQAASGKEALALAEKPFALLLTDISLGDMSGVELAARLRKARPELRVVYMSGYSDNPEIREVMARHESRFLQKPFTPAALAEMVRDAIA